MECESDPSLAINPVCDLKAVARDRKRFKIGATLVKPAAKVWVTTNYFHNFRPISDMPLFKFRIFNFAKTYTNHYMPGYIDVTQNYCSMVEAAANSKFILNVFDKLAPQISELYQKHARRCPVNGTIVAEMNFTSEVTDQPLIPPGEYANHYRWYNENNKTYYYLRLYSVRQDKQKQS
jgi:hypothetical protein